MKRLFVIALIALVPWPVLAADKGAPGADTNLLYAITIAEVGAEGGSTVRAAKVLARDGSRAKLLTGWRVPIPTTTTSAGDGGEPMTTFSYQDIGVRASLDGKILGESGIRVHGHLEVSAVDPAGAVGASAPRVATFAHEFDVLLDDGVTAVLAEVPRPEGGSLVFKLSAAIQD